MEFKILAKIKLIPCIMLRFMLCKGSWVEILLHPTSWCLFSSRSTLCTMFAMQYFFFVILHERAVQRYAAQGARLATHDLCYQVLQTVDPEPQVVVIEFHVFMSVCISWCTVAAANLLCMSIRQWWHNPLCWRYNNLMLRHSMIV